MAALTKESLERLLLSGRITPKRTTAIRKPSSLAASDGSRDRYQYQQDAVEAFHNHALSPSQLDYLQRQAARIANTANKEVSKINLEAVLRSPKKTPARRQGRRAGDGTRSSAKSGDGNDGDSDPDPERRPSSFHLYDQGALAALLRISKHTLQNLYSKTPHLLPAAIQIPGARGPRWTPEAVQEWLSARPKHTPKPVVAAPRRKVGRPRIAALRSNGGA